MALVKRSHDELSIDNDMNIKKQKLLHESNDLINYNISRLSENIKWFVII